ncbi:MAG: hypothetical protein IPP71_12135 [Bacteroidetes bacterium]|nr:hypothetical protein [Bacteroidota bacterium]
MEQAANLENLFNEAKALIAQGKETEYVRNILSQSGVDTNVIDTIINQIKSQQFLKRRKRGFMLMAVGSILLFIGFLLTVFFFHSGISIHYVMYGMTSVGVLLLIAGLVEVVGW